MSETNDHRDLDFTGAEVPEEAFESPSDEAIAEFLDHGGEAPTYHPILRIWREVLSNAEDELGAKVTPQWANRVTSSYRELNFRDMPRFRDLYFGKVLEMASVLETIVESDEECLTYTTPEEDVEHNSQHYKDLLMHWQILMLGWEVNWDCESEDAALEVAAISEVHKMFFGSPAQQGLTAFLDSIKFEYTEADQADLAEALAVVKEGR